MEFRVADFSRTLESRLCEDLSTTDDIFVCCLARLLCMECLCYYGFLCFVYSSAESRTSRVLDFEAAKLTCLYMSVWSFSCTFFSIPFHTKRFKFHALSNLYRGAAADRGSEAAYHMVRYAWRKHSCIPLWFVV